MSTDSSTKNAAHWQELEAWRKKIDAIDRQLAGLLCQRLECARNIISLKAQIGEEVLQPVREKEVLNNVLSQADSPITEKALSAIYQAIIEESRKFQHEWKNSSQQLER